MTRLPGLDALRGIAALIVATAHMQHFAGTPVIGPYFLAVDVFFVLSGYVLARTYEASLQDGQLTSPEFVTIRIRRLWPTMAVGALIGALAFSNSPPSAILLATIACLLWGPMLAGNETAYPTNTPTWSVAVEVAMNLLHGRIFAKLGTAWLAAIAFGLFATLLTFAPSWNVGPKASDFLWSPLRAAFGYCSGVIIWRRLGDLPKMPFWPVLLLPTIAFIPIDARFLALATPLFVICAIQNPPSGLQRALSWAGSVSFPLYAVHYPVGVLIIQRLNFGSLHALIAAILLAVMINHFLNKPVVRQPISRARA